MSIIASIFKNGTTRVQTPQRYSVSLDVSSPGAIASSERRGLEEQLLLERQRANEKEEEIVRMRVQMTKLEEMLEQQAQINQMDEEHLTKLETALTHAKDAAPAREQVAELESELRSEREAKTLKEEELVGMQTLVSKLEETIDQQSKVAALNKEQQAVIIDLMQSLSEEKRKVEHLAKAEESAVVQLQEQLHTLQTQLAEASERQASARLTNDEEMQHRLEETKGRMSELEAEISKKDEHIAHLEAESEAIVCTAAHDRQVSTRSAASEISEFQLAAMSQQLEAMEAQYKDLMREMKHREAHVAGLQAQLACEESKRKAAERVICAAENEIRHLKDGVKERDNTPTKDELTASRRHQARKGASSAPRSREKAREEHAKAQEQLKKEFVLRQQAQETIASKEAEVKEMKAKLLEEEVEHMLVKEQATRMQQEVGELQKRLAEEYEERQTVQTKFIEKERKSLEMQTSTSLSTGTKAARAKMLEKDVQICELQQDLQTELAKRQMTQSKAIELEEQLAIAQQQLALELSRRVEAEGRAVEKDGQLKAIRKHLAHELLSSLQNKSTPNLSTSPRPDSGSFASVGLRSEDDEEGRSMPTPCSSSSYSRCRALPDTGSSTDDFGNPPEVAKSFRDSALKVHHTWGLSSPARSPAYLTRELIDPDVVAATSSPTCSIRRQRSQPEAKVAKVKLYTPGMPGTGGGLQPTVSQSFMPMAVTSQVSPLSPQVSVRPPQQVGGASLVTSSKSASKTNIEVHAYATSSPNMTSVARVMRAASLQ
mmetsp:Transcript_38539/g.86666  ORF Transcript_38539/g.86666 Transcript_38539/m.86666 type:complete len:774 (-) Transcript_38539:133-2454(-)